MLHTRIFRFNPLETNCVLLWKDGAAHCVIADPGMWGDDEVSQLTDFLGAQGLKPSAILLTHGHADHILGVKALCKLFQPRVYVHEADMDLPPLSFLPRFDFRNLTEGVQTVPVADGQAIDEAGLHIKVIHTPGHTPGSVCYYLESDNLLLSGDTLMAGTIGRTDLPGGDYDSLMGSITQKLLHLPGETDIVPGHGQPSSIAREGMYNPFLEPFNEPSNEDTMA